MERRQRNCGDQHRLHTRKPRRESDRWSLGSDYSTPLHSPCRVTLTGSHALGPILIMASVVERESAILHIIQEDRIFLPFHPPFLGRVGLPLCADNMAGGPPSLGGGDKGEIKVRRAWLDSGLCNGFGVISYAYIIRPIFQGFISFMEIIFSDSFKAYNLKFEI